MRGNRKSGGARPWKAMLLRRTGKLRDQILELEREKAQLVSMICAAPVGIALLDRDLRVIRANHAMRRIAGERMVADADLKEAFPPLEPLCLGVLENGKPAIDREICEGPSGNNAPPHCWLATAYAVPGSVPGLMVILSDRTGAKAEAERATEARVLEIVGRLAGGIAHDFNNLLVGIMGGASLALEDLPDDHPARRHLEFVLRSGDRAAELTRLLLAYSGKGRLFRSKVDVASVVRETCDGLRPLIPPLVRLEIDSEPRLPSLMADAAQIGDITKSLVLNAAEAIGEREGSIRVSIGTTRLSGRRYVVLEVSDDGCGMDQATMNSVFDPFFTTKFAGRGLGLAAVQGIVRNLDGSIRVSSSPGHGSTFTILLKAPAHAAAAPSR
jgi:nitrogen-specific signal transduction histidine kinase